MSQFEKKETKKVVKRTKIEDDLFGSFSSTSKPSANFKDDDDLFSLVDNKSSKSDSSVDFNFDDYIAKQKNTSASKGGLFD